jgi:hypothetical protein
MVSMSARVARKTRSTGLRFGDRRFVGGEDASQNGRLRDQVMGSHWAIGRGFSGGCYILQFSFFANSSLNAFVFWF